MRHRKGNGRVGTFPGRDLVFSHRQMSPVFSRSVGYFLGKVDEDLRLAHGIKAFEPGFIDGRRQGGFTRYDEFGSSISSTITTESLRQHP